MSTQSGEQAIAPSGKSVPTGPRVEVRIVPQPAAAAPVAKRASAAAPLVQEIDDFDLPAFTVVAKRFRSDRFGFVVTPNVDHMIRLHDDSEFRAHYRTATFVLNDSQFAARMVRIVKGIKLPVCTGSDLTRQLISESSGSDEKIVLVGGSTDQAAQIATDYRLMNVRHYNPPMGFIKDPAAVERCLQFIESQSPFRYCFLAIGSPQQEAIAEQLRVRGVARGLALCVGASLNFLVGAEKRAPRWMQRLALEWLYRLLQNPRRMAGRYLVRGPRFFTNLRRMRFVLRKTPLAD